MIALEQENRKGGNYAEKNIKKVVILIILISFMFGYGENIASASSENIFVYEEETFKVTYIKNNVWEENFVNATFEIENTGDEPIRNWFLGIPIDGKIKDIWDATVYKHVEGHYVIKNAVFNSNIAPGETVRFGCIMELQDKDWHPNEIYMPVKTKEVACERYGLVTEYISSWEHGSEYKVTIVNKSKRPIEDWTIEFELEDEICSLWNGQIVEEEGAHYILTNNGYNGVIASGGSVSFGFLTNANRQVSIEDVALKEVTSDGIKISEKLIDERNFNELKIITAESEVTPLYAVDGRISAYLVQYFDEGNPTGYIIVSNEVNCLNYYIEFGSGKPYVIEEMISLVEDECNEDIEHIIYMGGYTYYALVGDKIYPIINMEQRMLTFEEEQKLVAIGSETQYYEKEVTLSLADVYSKEVGYAWVSERETPNVPLITSFKTMTDTRSAYFEKEGKIICNHCGPTAGVNMLIYLANKGYAPLAVDGAEWKAAFCKLYKDMKTCDATGTYDNNIETTMRNLFNKYAGTVVERFYSISWEDATAYLARGAVIFNLSDSQIYSDHAVLGVGYISFMFSSGWKSRYLKIVDGWSNQQYRYVNYLLGIDHIGAVTIEVGAEPFPVPAPTP